VAQLKATVKDAEGRSLPGATVVFFSTAPAAVSVAPNGTVRAHRAGEHNLVALSPSKPQNDASLYQQGDPGVRVNIPVKVAPSPLARLEFGPLPDRLYAGMSIPVSLFGTDIDQRRTDVRPSLAVSNEALATFTAFGPLFQGSDDAHPFYRRTRPDLFPGEAAGILSALRPGSVTLTATSEGVKATLALTIQPNPVHSLELDASAAEARTGDVIRFQPVARDERGQTIADPPVQWAIEAWSDPARPDSVGAGAPAQITREGRFVAEQPGVYSVLATAGAQMARRRVRIVPRNLTQRIEFVGHAPVRDRITSDLWVWQGADGRDYAVVGTWNADGHALFFDVTDPTAMQRVSSVQVDARTVNDVKVSEDGRLCVITREGASNRRNGLVVIDVSNPRDPKILARYDDQLTGGVHNVFIHDKHVYAINNGRRWDVINIEDPTKPLRVARFENTTPGRSVHDVWVREGIAYQAGNSDGVLMVDVGGGGRGGSPARPVLIGQLPQLTGWNHSVWPFRSKSAGKFYVVAGDEAHPVNPRVPGEIISWRERVPSRAMGWIVYVALQGVNQVVEVDLDRWKVARRFHTQNGPYNLGVSPDGRILIVTCKLNGSTAFWDLDSGEELKSVANTRKVTHGVATSSDGRFAFVSVEGVGGEPGAVEVFDLKTLERRAAIDVGKQASGIDFWKMVR
jgi:WD40 repeat protein